MQPSLRHIGTAAVLIDAPRVVIDANGALAFFGRPFIVSPIFLAKRFQPVQAACQEG
jgi:hypothetical protein